MTRTIITIHIILALVLGLRLHDLQRQLHRSPSAFESVLFGDFPPLHRSSPGLREDYPPVFDLATPKRTAPAVPEPESELGSTDAAQAELFQPHFSLRVRGIFASGQHRFAVLELIDAGGRVTEVFRAATGDTFEGLTLTRIDTRTVTLQLPEQHQVRLKIFAREALPEFLTQPVPPGPVPLGIGPR